MKREEPSVKFFLALFPLLVGNWLLHSRGLHFDENSYLRLALTEPLGDARADGKPPLFYLLNWAAARAVGSPYLLYLAFNAFALAWLAGRLPLTRGRQWIFAGLIAVSPLYLLNSTQLMMETPMLGMECLLFGVLLPGTTAGPWALPAAVTVLVLLKESALPALAALAGGAFFRDRALARRLGKSIVLALLISQAVRLVCGVPQQHYGGFFEIARVARWPERLSHTGDYLGLWLFLIGPVLAAGVGWWGMRRRVRVAPLARGLFLTGLFSLPLLVALELSVGNDYARYAYPLLFAALLSWSLLALQSPGRAWVAAIASGTVLAGAPLWQPHGSSFPGWPLFIKGELYWNEGTVLTGFPLHAWTLRARARSSRLCLMTSDPARYGMESARAYLRATFPRTMVFDEAQRERFVACEGPKAILLRGEAVPLSCQCPPNFAFSITRCGEIRPGGPRELTCLP